MTILRRVPDVIPFRPFNLEHVAECGETLASCGLCSAVIIDDKEGANRGEHEAWHRNVVETLKALIDGKADNGFA